MERRKQIQLLLALIMFLISIYMTISYGLLVAHHAADRLTTIAFYVWIFSIVAWFAKLVHDFRSRQHS
ncbi:MAG: hypothetical protein KDC57_10670 [Saprospiraceae bacterium]|nr:hypothetical protein [Saprospiraceae bacterium]